MRSRTWLPVALTAAALFLTSAAPSAASDPVDLGAAIAFRASYGLTTDAVFIRDVESSTVAIWDYGFALTPAEEADLRRRDEMASQIKPLVERLERDPSFGGLYIDQVAGGVIDIATTGDPAVISQEAQPVAPGGASLRVRQVQFTEQGLADLQQGIMKGLQADAASRATTVFSVGIDVKANRVAVVVSDVTNPDALALEQAYGPAVEVVRGEPAVRATCTSRSACPPANKGGLSIHATAGGYVYTCTSAFSARDLSLRTLYLYTAGHCILDSGLNVTWYMGTTAIGAGTVERYYNDTTADVGLIALNSANRVTPLNQVFASSNLDVRSMAGWWGNSSQTVGKTVCRSGQTSGWRCGTIAATNINVNIGGTWVLHQWETSYSSALGDSGATMMDNGVAWMGVLSSITSTNSFYGTVDYAIQEPFGGSHLLNPCVSSGC